MFGKREWVPAEGTIVEVRVEPGHKDPYAAPKLYVVDLRPSVGAPYRAEVQFRYQDYPRTHQPDPGEVTGFGSMPSRRRSSSISPTPATTSMRGPSLRRSGSDKGRRP
jgi:hypothetical protein